MTLASYAYGTVAGVAVQARRFTNAASTFDDSTHPTYEQVETWINEISSMINTMLETHNITTPVDETELVALMGSFVNSEVAAMVNGVNGAGRLGPSSKTVQQIGMYGAIQYDVQTFIDKNFVGIQNMGAARTSPVSRIMTREYDEDGNKTFPLFSRNSWGGETFTEGN